MWYIFSTNKIWNSYLFVGYYNRKECKVYYHNKSNNIYIEVYYIFFNIEKNNR